MFKTLITIPLGYILGFIYDFVLNYGWSLVVFTLAIKIILLPLGLKQQKSMTRMQLVQPKVQEIQKKYENDKNKQSEEMMKLYKEYNISPMGGCLPMLIQLPILFGLYRVIYQPLTYMLHMSADQVAELTKKCMGNADFVAKFGDITAGARQTAEIAIAKAEGLVNFDFLGLDLSMSPSLGRFDWLWLIPVLAGVTTYITSKITTWINAKDKEDEEPKKPVRVLSPDQKPAGNGNESTMKTMTYVMPLMTTWIAFSFPAALGLYWIMGNVVSIGQTFLLNGYYSKKLKAEFEVLEEEKAVKKAEKMKRRKRG